MWHLIHRPAFYGTQVPAETLLGEKLCLCAAGMPVRSNDERCSSATSRINVAHFFANTTSILLGTSQESSRIFSEPPKLLKLQTSRLNRTVSVTQSMTEHPNPSTGNCLTFSFHVVQALEHARDDFSSSLEVDSRKSHQTPSLS